MEGLEIKKNRKKLFLTQSDLADIIEVSARTVQDWEQNRHKPRKIQINKLNTLFKGVRNGKNEPTKYYN